MFTPIELIKAYVDGMQDRKFGRIINITSSSVKAPIDILGLSNGARSGLTGFVAGITRKTIISLAKELGIKTVEKKISLEEVFDCDEAFFTGTAAEVTPIVEINDKKINNGAPGEITKKLQKDYFNLVSGKNGKYKDWLTVIKKLHD